MPSRPEPAAFEAALTRPLDRIGVDRSALVEGWTTGAPIVRFYKAFAQARRRLGDHARQPFAFLPAEAASLYAIYPGFEPDTWSLPTLARVWLMHQVPAVDAVEVFGKLLRHAEIREQVAVYRGLYTLANPEAFTAEVAEGVRTNMVDVFDAVGLDNPIGAWLLDDGGFAQLVLKAVFMARPLYRIVGLEARQTPTLAASANDYAHERWSAGRSIHPELWRLLDATTDSHRQTLVRAKAIDDPLTVRAASWALGERDATLWPDRTLPDDDAAAWRTIGVEAAERADSSATRDVLYPSPKPPQEPS